VADSSYQDRQGLTFAQAEGVEPLPTQLKRAEISPRLAALVWAFLNQEISSSAVREQLGRGRFIWRDIFSDYHVHSQCRPIDEFRGDSGSVLKQVKSVMYSNDYAKFYELLQFIARHAKRPNGFVDEIAKCLKAARAPFTLVNGDTFVPIASEEEVAAAVRAFEDTSVDGLAGPQAHLRAAAEALTIGQYTDGIRESIHAVESVARTLAPSGSLGDALAILEKEPIGIHGGLKSGFKSIYGYTSDEKGIRHPLLEKGSADVDETDAIFMFSACAAFVSYLIAKARKAGLSNPSRRG
jgi:hypothetical protein